MTDPGLSEKAHNDLVLSFLAVRRAIGVLGFFLPTALLAYGLASGTLLPSLSAAYYSPMREVFVGTLIALAVFLWSYEGFRPNAGEVISDKATARVAAVSAALVALAPTLKSGETVEAVTFPDCTLLQCILGPDLSARLHFVAAATFFAALAVYCLVLFVRGKVDSPEKRGSNRIYRLCGWLIVISIVATGLLYLTGLDQRLAVLRPVFWLETVATFSFATSWMVKGDALRPLVRRIGSQGAQVQP